MGNADNVVGTRGMCIFIWRKE